MSLRHILFIPLICAALGTAAAEPSDSIAVSEQLSGVEVSARKPRNSVTTSMPVQTLGIGEMRRLGITDMADAVRRFAGATVRDYGGIGGLKTVSVRNMGAAHTAVSYDGVAMTNTQGGQIDIGRFSLDNVATVSLAVGSEPDMLQSARLHASAAVLAITTSRPQFSLLPSTSIEASVKAGSWSTINPYLRLGKKLGRAILSLDGDFLHTRGDYPFTIPTGSEPERSKRLNADNTSTHSELNLYLPTSADGELHVKGYYFWSERGLPGSVTFYNPVSTERLTDRNFFAQARYRFSPLEKWRFEAAAKYSYGYNLDLESGPQYDGGVYRSRHSQKEYYLTASAAFTPISPLTIALAQDAAIGSLSSTMSSCPFPTRFTSVSALSLRWRRGILTANATLTATHISESVKEGSRPDPLTRANPSVGVSIRPFSSRQFFVRGMYKRTFRAPTFTDLYYDRVGNRSLRPEDADEFNLGLTFNTALFPAMAYLTLTADGYFNSVTDKIVAIPSTYTWRMMNYGKVRIKGLDLTLATAFSLPHSINLALTGAYSLQHAVDVTDPASKTYRHQLPYTPRHSGNASVSVTTPWITVGYTILGVGKRYYMAQNIPQNEIRGYVEQSVTLSRELTLGKCLLTLRAEAINIGNVEYEVIKFYPMPGRSWRLTAMIKL